MISIWYRFGGEHMGHAMKISVSRRKTCQLCDGTKLELVVPLLPTPVAVVCAFNVELQRQGKTIWGYGAARSGTTLISRMNLGKVIRFIVGDSPDKQGKFSLCLPEIQIISAEQGLKT
ncbi:MAG: hypothetical protein ABSH14_15635 [Verrucomicrobiia bacterium]|jgi:hypothetical protein